MRLKMRGTATRIVGFTSGRFATRFCTSSLMAIDIPWLMNVCSSAVCPNACAQ
jgi:hypothetical protein